jgi:two-component system cell cycle sensor histidine kinase/response regulator CckA
VTCEMRAVMSTRDARPVVLVVDDEAPLRRAMCRILEFAGYHVIEAGDGATALKLTADDTPIDLLLADISMPEVSGDEIARRLRTTRPDLKILYVSGEIDRLLNERPLRREESFLEKPFTRDGLTQAVSFALFGSAPKPT